MTATVMIDMAGIGLIVPVVPNLARDVVGTDLSGAAWLGGLPVAAHTAMQFLFGPAVGNLSDVDGRRPLPLAAGAGRAPLGGRSSRDHHSIVVRTVFHLQAGAARLQLGS